VYEIENKFILEVGGRYVRQSGISFKKKSQEIGAGKWSGYTRQRKDTTV